MNKKGCLQRNVLMCAQKPRTKTISCKGQAVLRMVAFTRDSFVYSGTSRASVLETLLTAQTRLVLPTAIHTEDRRERSTQTDRHENIDASKWRLEHRAGWGLVYKPTEVTPKASTSICPSQYYSWHSTPPLLHSPPHCMLQSILRSIWFPPAPPLCHSTYNIGNSHLV